MDRPNPTPTLHGTRFHHERTPHYYAYGNTQAQNFLEYASSDLEIAEPSVLVIGCGDIRSCFHTIWKNFDPGFKHRFKGVRFVLNDRNAAVLARNIVFLYLCLKTPKIKADRKEWLYAMWSIWFCHELLPAHQSVLQNALKALLKFSENVQQWSNTDNPLHSLVLFFSTTTFKEVRTFWSMWYNREVKVDSVKSMKVARQEVQRRHCTNIKRQSISGTLDVCGIVGMELSRNKIETMTNEYQSYLESGSVFGETLSGAVRSRSPETSVNLTLYERRDGEYTLHYSSCPFRCFQQTYICSVEKMISAGIHIAVPANDYLLTNPEAFERTPLLANSFQQFSISVICTANVLQNQQANISFTFNCLEVFEFCHSWEVECNKKQFDLIFATNVIDSVAPPAFILSVIRLLKDNGYFLSSTMLFFVVAPTIEEYIATVFGFHSELLPVISGIRCVNHEGSAYASPISPSHIPVDTYDIDMSMSDMHEKILIWEKVSADPLCVNSLISCPEISLALANSFEVSCSSLLTNVDGLPKLNYLCTDTSIEVLKTFTTRLNTDLWKSHSFWVKLCSDLQHRDILKPFLASIQSQALTKGLHLHLVVDESTCPMCMNSPLSDYLGLFCVVAQTNKASDFFLMVRLERKVFPLTYQYFDCSVGVMQGSTLKLHFLAPLSFVKDGYQLTLVQCTPSSMAGKKFNSPNIILQGELSEYLLDMPSVPPPPHWPQPLPEHSSSLGTLIKHCGNGDAFESALSFAEDKLPALLSADLRVEQISCAEVKIQCLGRCLQIRYPYPVAYDKLIVQRDKKSKTLIVKAKRKAHCYDDEGQLFHVNPEDHFSLPPVMLSLEMLERNLLYQYTQKERGLIFGSDPLAMTSPLLKVKRILILMLTLSNDFYYRLQLPGSNIVGLVKIINRVIDVHRRVHAVDLCFCFLDTLSEDISSFISWQLEQEYYATMYSFKNLFLYKEAYDLLKKVFYSFASHTLQSAGKYPLSSPPPCLTKCGIDGYFTRAVVYPLYPDSAIAALELKNIVNCSHCKCLLEPHNLKKCSKCKTAPYCSRQCQTSHWSEHKLQCKSTKRNDKSPGSNQGSSSHNSQLSAAVQQEHSHDPTAEDRKSSEHMLGQNRCEELPNTHKQAKASEQSSLSSLVAQRKQSPNPTGAVEEDRKLKPSSSDKQSQATGSHLKTLRNERCSYCQKRTPSLKSCLGCHKVSYCGRECQRAHWKQHKDYCKPLK